MEEEEEEEKEESAAFVPFGGQGHCLGGDDCASAVKPAEPAKIEGGAMTTAADLNDVSDCSLCPNCGKYISNVSFNIHKMRCARFNVRCPICNQSVPRTSLEAHNKENHVPIPCEQCGASFLPADMAKHKANDCPDVLVPCKYCQLNVLRKKLREHENICGSKSTNCPICGASVAKNMLDQHISLGCRKRSPSPTRGGGGGGTMHDPFRIDDDEDERPRRGPLAESGAVCPKCHKTFGYAEIVDHVENCGRAPPPQKRPLQESGIVCPKCHKTFGFGEIVEHAEHCRGPTSEREEEKVMCPKCGKMFGISEIVDHTDRCGQPQRRSPSPPRRPPPSNDTFICPYCNRSDFPTEMQYLQHLANCANSRANSSSSSSRYQQQQQHQGRNSDGLKVCPFCGVFKSDIEAAMQMHMQACATQFT